MHQVRRWQLDSRGTLIETETTPPQLTPGHVLVHIHALCLLPAESLRLGHSFSGTVLQSFHNSPWSIGSRVWGYCTNTDISEQVIVPDWAIHKLKTNLSFVENATLAGPALLACHALQIAALPGSGRPRVLVHGGHTAIGTFAIQAARVMKCDVEATVPLEYREACRELGCAEFIDLQDSIPHGITLASFRGRRERNFHLVIDTLADDISIYDNIEKFTHEHSKYVTVKERSVSWGGFLKRMTTSVPRDYHYLKISLSSENAKKQLDLVSNLITHPEFIRIVVQDEYSIEDLATALKAADGPVGLGCVVVELSGAYSTSFDELLEAAMKAGQLNSKDFESSGKSRGGSSVTLGSGFATKGTDRPKRDSDHKQQKVFSIE